MDYVWANGPCDVKAVYKALGPAREITANTVQSTMERLYRKDILGREKVSHAYVYSARLSREEVTAQAVVDVVACLSRGESDALLTTFVDVAARAGDETLERLERLVAERRARERRR